MWRVCVVCVWLGGCVTLTGCAPMTVEDRAALAAGIDAMTMGLEGMRRPVAVPQYIPAPSLSMHCVTTSHAPALVPFGSGRIEAVPATSETNCY